MVICYSEYLCKLDIYDFLVTVLRTELENSQLTEHHKPASKEMDQVLTGLFHMENIVLHLLKNTIKMYVCEFFCLYLGDRLPVTT